MIKKFMYAVYDVETKNLIPNKSYMDNNYTYCRGWGDYLGMGISMVGLYVDDHPEVYTNLKEFESRINELQDNGYFVGGFNNDRFDDKLLQAHGVNINSNFDLYKAIKEIVGYFTPGYSLDSIAEMNGLSKLGDGADAPKLYQDGKLKELEDYLVRDLYITYELVRKKVDETLIL